MLPTTDDGCRPAASNCWSLTSVTISLDEGGGDTASSLSCTKGVNIGSCAGSTKQMYDQSKNYRSPVQCRNIYIFDSTFDQRIISLPVESEICFELDVFFKEFVLGVVVEHS